MLKFIKKHPFMCSVGISLLAGLVLYFGMWLSDHSAKLFDTKRLFSDMGVILVIGGALGIFVVYPIVLTAINMAGLFFCHSTGGWKKTAKYFEYITILLGGSYTMLVHLMLEIQYNADWQETLHNSQLHTPVNTASYPTVICLAGVAVLGFLVLSFVPVGKLPPLVAVCSISAMYIGIGECVAWILQMCNKEGWILCLFPANCVIIAIKTMLVKIREWNLCGREERVYKNKLLQWCNAYLGKSERWPWAAFLLMWPLLGICVCVLALFGQRPDAVIRAWTETSDWNLSQRTAPQNVMYDEHYLCTVAAGGHAKVVKPLRLGVRHGHGVIVNRQLCVANAFEQLLEERMPAAHRRIRRFYDTYGFPIAKMIHSPHAVDLVYFMMKPLEWVFLIVLYSCDVKPENRIAVQYLPKMPVQ